MPCFGPLAFLESLVSAQIAAGTRSSDALGEEGPVEARVCAADASLDSTLTHIRLLERELGRWAAMHIDVLLNLDEGRWSRLDDHRAKRGRK